MRTAPISIRELEKLQRSNSPQAHFGGQGTPGLRLSYQLRPNPLTTGIYPTLPCVCVSDHIGFLCALQDADLIPVLLALEATRLGSVRRLITGLSPEHWSWDLTPPSAPATLALANLDLKDLKL